MRQLLLSTALASVAFVPGALHAQPESWNGFTDTVFSNAANWDSGVAPAAGDTVTIQITPSNNPVVTANTANLAAVTLTSGTIGINAGATLFTDSLTLDFGSTVNGPGTVSTKSLLLNGGLVRTDVALATQATLADGTISGNISGAGAVLLTSGSTSLSGTNTYSGGTTISAGSLLTVGNGHTSGSITGDVLNNSVLSFARSDTTTYGGVISGTGVVNKGGTGTLILTGANTYGGGTNIVSGTLKTGASNVLSSSSALNIAAGATLDLNNTQQTVGSLAGAGTVYSAGAATLKFGGDNTSTSFSGSFAGGNLSSEKQGTGTFSFSGTSANSALSGSFTVSGGTLAMVGAGSLRDSGLSLQSGTTLDISATTAGASFGFITASTGTAIHLGSRTLTIENTLTSTSSNLSGVIDGSGGLTVGQNSTLILRAVNTFTGPTTLTTASSTISIARPNAISASSEVNLAARDAKLEIFNARVDVSIQALRGVTDSLVLVDNNNLVITNAASNFAGSIRPLLFGGTGGLILNGGHQTLSGINTYRSATTVNAGTLSVNGSIATSALTTVNTGGTLGGNGTVGNTAISGGALAPGNSIGTLRVNGNLSFTAASSYMVEVSPTNADRTNVTGTATLGGATVNTSFAPGSYVARQYTILNATGGLGGSTFGTLANSNLPSSVTSNLSYDANNVYLNLALSFAVPGGLSGNQTNVGNALTGFFDSTGGIPLAFAALTPAGLSQVSGETATGSQQTTFDAMNQFMGVMTDPFIGGRGDTSPPSGASQFTEAGSGRGAGRDAYAMITKAGAPIPFAPRWSVWAAGYGGSQTTNGNATLGSSTATSRIYGTAVGADYRFSPNTLAGFALAGGGTNFDLNGFGSGRSDLFQAGVFLRHTVGAAYFSGALAYGWQDVTTDRTVTVAGIDRLRAQFNANAWSGRAEGGYRFATPLIGLTPYAAGQFTTFELPAYAETVVSGANTFALAYGSKTVTASRSELGLRTDKSFAMNDAVLTLRGRAAWAHDYNPDRSINATFQTLPGAGFTVNGAAQSADKALTTASAEVKWMSGFSLAATFEGEFAGNLNSYAGKGVARYMW